MVRVNRRIILRAFRPFFRQLVRAFTPGLCFTMVWIVLFSPQALATEISVRLVNAKTGKPFPKVRVAMSMWNGNFDIKRPPLPHKDIVDATTDSNGRVVFRLPQPTPEHLGFDVGSPLDFAGCWTLPDFSIEAVERLGLVAGYNESKCGESKARVSAKPGEIVIVERKLTLAEKMRRELP